MRIFLSAVGRQYFHWGQSMETQLQYLVPLPCFGGADLYRPWSTLGISNDWQAHLENHGSRYCLSCLQNIRLWFLRYRTELKAMALRMVFKSKPPWLCLSEDNLRPSTACLCQCFSTSLPGASFHHSPPLWKSKRDHSIFMYCGPLEGTCCPFRMFLPLTQYPVSTPTKNVWPVANSNSLLGFTFSPLSSQHLAQEVVSVSKKKQRGLLF